LIVRGADRGEAIDRSLEALADFAIEGVETTCELLSVALSHDDFKNDTINTRWLETAVLPALSHDRTTHDRTTEESNRG
jgi:acetyl/propionyl-CoA carboxylase alpha subunit